MSYRGWFSAVALVAATALTSTVSLLGWLPESERVAHIILTQIRLPRLIAGALAGAALGVAGLLVQGALRNPLAVPEFLGVSGGAALASAVVVTYELGAGSQRPLIALLGGLAGGGLCLYAARRARTPSATLLIGAAVSIGIQGLVLSVMATADQLQLAIIYRYLVGSLAGITMQTLVPLAVPIGIGLVLAVAVTPLLGLLSLGDDAATTLGLSPQRARIVVLVIAAGLVAVVVAPVGPLAWVSLLGPTVARRLWPGLDPRWLPIGAGTVGAAITLFADLLARQLFAPFETPVGAWTSMAGVIAAVLVIRQRQATA